ncbi:helix-turn-helix transcriptional regulator [Amycolatopsis sp. WQ 127309]|uniref:helix-turn-helix transcriptional regulator n=1 Tax=Amycolatopsis sp. WQ 127309 TaxID=2932773 RepID=UPI001FF511DA|nr:helix-turn-helix transcriptional regulator [Amycolatopsis sp. WQ 127309]UOZ02669.1 helix-turn-helix transcriptional regulator [Amycolatopsis sp. WQ 127309]
MTEDPRRALAEFLRTRRTRVRPQDVGLEPGPRRRVAGLRREELALLAGVSSDYYQRMEQGRDVRPSGQVLDAIARALDFSAEETRHLHSLAAAARTPARPARRYPPEEVPPTTLRLLRATTSPALVVGRFLDVLAWNPLAGALLGAFTEVPRAERNLLALLLHPEADRACPERAATVAELTGMLRAQVAAEPGHPRAVELVGALAVRSAEFATLWARHDVEATTRGRMRVNHPLVGELNLDWDAYAMPGEPGPVLIVCTAEPGGPDDDRLRLLAGLLDAPRATETSTSSS